LSISVSKSVISAPQPADGQRGVLAHLLAGHLNKRWANHRRHAQAAPRLEAGEGLHPPSCKAGLELAWLHDCLRFSLLAFCNME
jgi:hypothetical protein